LPVKRLGNPCDFLTRSAMQDGKTPFPQNP